MMGGKASPISLEMAWIWPNGTASYPQASLRPQGPGVAVL
ncbi:hypothetical protein ACCUM_4503 [Candidatus Accumulibacter phosphatis]|uniref:Uncharacterized protein n=2 Tax=Candidatus Accumulibacter TaxID=327159 RepID=A0A080M9Y0_9PROT|nr:MAG: hypothetical protein AW06_000575 [Candidatus Accumulibacter cognatus]TMQ76301.1 hypothetical protein ACCUM_4503 [Candidatus Accumulibacter phosphatis]